ncbi:hypothetical protein Taro_022123 [Colocasia esculenta]|uniref:Uncharacterized protein n=1 Tax=Colocasia esculenta TaxID=4460 RepID=A0A843V330_COLES|nr:hypothetical protein [Colocasia esculenta]
MTEASLALRWDQRLIADAGFDLFEDSLFEEDPLLAVDVWDQTFGFRFSLPSPVDSGFSSSFPTSSLLSRINQSPPNNLRAPMGNNVEREREVIASRESKYYPSDELSINNSYDNPVLRTTIPSRSSSSELELNGRNQISVYPIITFRCGHTLENGIPEESKEASEREGEGGTAAAATSSSSHRLGRRTLPLRRPDKGAGGRVRGRPPPAPNLGHGLQTPDYVENDAESLLGGDHGDERRTLKQPAPGEDGRQREVKCG